MEKLKPLTADDIFYCLRFHLAANMLTANEAKFAAGVVSFYKYQGKLSEKQREAARNLLLRVVKTRQIPAG